MFWGLRKIALILENDISKCVYVQLFNENIVLWIIFVLAIIPRIPIDNKSPLVMVMVWYGKQEESTCWSNRTSLGVTRLQWIQWTNRKAQSKWIKRISISLFQFNRYDTCQCGGKCDLNWLAYLTSMQRNPAVHLCLALPNELSVNCPFP